MSTRKGRSKDARKRPRCSVCGRAIYRPNGWSSGATTRKHYWAKHRDVMEQGRKGR